MMNDGVDNKLIGHLNDGIILHHLLMHQQLSKAALAKLCKLTPRSIQLIVNRLLKRSLVKELPAKKGNVGQPSTPIALNSTGAYGIGIKVGRRRLTVQASNLCLEINHRVDKTYESYDEATILHDAQLLLRDIMDKIPHDTIKGITCVTPFEYRGFADKLSAKTKRPITPLIDIHAAAIAEQWLHNVPVNNYFYIFIGTYITGVMVINRRIYGIGNNQISDFGALSLGLNGKTLHEHCSLIYLDEKLISMKEQGVLVNGLTGSENLNPDALSQHTKTIITEWLDNASWALGTTLNQAQSIMNLDNIIIETALPKKFRRDICQKTLKHTHNISVIEGNIGASARSYGAAIHPILSHFQPDILRDYQ